MTRYLYILSLTELLSLYGYSCSLAAAAFKFPHYPEYPEANSFPEARGQSVG